MNDARAPRIYTAGVSRQLYPSGSSAGSWTIGRRTVRPGAFDNLVCIGRNVPIGAGDTASFLNNIYVSPLGQVIAIEAARFGDRLEQIAASRIAELGEWTADDIDDVAAQHFYHEEGQAATVMDIFARKGLLPYSSAERLHDNIDHCIRSGNLIYIAIPAQR